MNSNPETLIPTDAPDTGVKTFGHVPGAAWAISCILLPPFLFVCLRVARLISTFETVLGFIATLCVQIGFISVLGNTEGEELQAFVDRAMLLSLFLLFSWVFLAGQRWCYWSPRAVKNWRVAGRFFGSVIFILLLLNVTAFHYVRHLKEERAKSQKAPGPPSYEPKPVPRTRMEAFLSLPGGQG